MGTGNFITVTPEAELAKIVCPVESRARPCHGVDAAPSYNGRNSGVISLPTSRPVPTLENSIESPKGDTSVWRLGLKVAPSTSPSSGGDKSW